MANRKFFSLQNGHSSQQQHNGQIQQNGSFYLMEPKVVKPEMAFFCFDVLSKELHGLERHVEPNHLGISNSSL